MNEHPLTKADFKTAQNGLYECEMWEREIKRQQACGLDCDEAEARCLNLRKFYQDVLDQYRSTTAPAPSS